MKVYYAELGHHKMVKALSELQDASRYIARGSRENGEDYNFMQTLDKMERTLQSETSRLAAIIKDKRLSSEDED